MDFPPLKLEGSRRLGSSSKAVSSVGGSSGWWFHDHREVFQGFPSSIPSSQVTTAIAPVTRNGAAVDQVWKTFNGFDRWALPTAKAAKAAGRQKQRLSS